MNTPIIPPASMRFLSASELESQASMTADEYLTAAIESIDSKLGEGYAKAHPELIGAFMRSSAQDFHTCFTSQILDRLAACQDGQATALENMAESLGNIASELAWFAESRSAPR